MSKEEADAERGAGSYAGVALGLAATAVAAGAAYRYWKRQSSFARGYTQAYPRSFLRGYAQAYPRGFQRGFQRAV